MRRAGRGGRGARLVGQQGFALVTVLTLMMVLTLLSALTMSASSSFLSQTVTPYVQTTKAVYVAEGGAQLAFQWLKSNYNLLGSSYLTTSGTSGALLLSSNSTAPALPGNHPDPYTDTGSTTRSGVVTSFNTYL
ncbi:MAG: hypothetical protein HYV08_18385, partial [Deltaproteobacteria bacterium]|nr:hypothetical protein [Deltaproteobacteria bacterium]